MNSSIVFVDSPSSHNLSRIMLMRAATTAFASAAVLGGLAVVIQSLFQKPFPLKLAQIRKRLLIFVSTPVKLMMFIFIGQTPLRYSGYLNRISPADVVKVAGFGGVGLSILYTLQERFKSTSLESQETSDADYQNSRHHYPEEQVKLDWALQEKIALSFICEIYHTIVGVVLGVFALRLLGICYMDQKHLDLLMLSGLLGPILFLVLVVLMTGIVFGISWAVRSR